MKELSFKEMKNVTAGCTDSYMGCDWNYLGTGKSRCCIRRTCGNSVGYACGPVEWYMEEGA